MRFWNDASLLAVNPLLAATAAALNVDLTQAIVPIGRSDPSSTTFEFTVRQQLELAKS